MTNATASRIGRVFYGLAVLGTGLQQLAIGQFVRIVARPPLSLPSQRVLAPLRRAPLALLGTGLHQRALGQFVRIVPRPPLWIPSQPVLARLGGVLLVAIGLALESGKLARVAASILAALLLAILLFLYLPAIPTNPLAGFMYTNPLKVLSLVGGLMLLVPLVPEDP